MGNSRPGGTLRPRDEGGTARKNADGGTSTHASGGPAVLAPAARSGTNKTVMDAPRLLRSSGQNAPAPSQERASTRLGNMMRPCSERKKNGAAAEEAPLGVSTAFKNSALSSLSRDSDRSAGSRNGAEEKMSESARNGNASSSSKKRKGTNSRSYLKRFKAIQGANATGAVVASPDRVGKENTSGGHVADSNISKLCESSRLIEKNKRHLRDAVSKVSRSLVVGLHEISETRLNQCSVPFSEESSASECTNTEHIEIDNTAKTGMLLGGANSLVRGVNANYDGTLDTDRVHLECPDLASSQNLVDLVGTQAVLSCMSPQQGTDLSAQQNVALSRCPPAEAEQTGLLGTQAVKVSQPEMQPSVLFSDATPQKTHPDDRSQTGCEPNRAIGLSQGGTTSHHSGGVRMQVQEKYDGNVAADPVLSESPTYPADSPVILHMATKVEFQICEPSMAAKQSTNPPAQQTSAISWNPPAEAEQLGILGTEAAWDLQTEGQPLVSMLDQPTQAEQAGMLGSIAAQDLQREMQSSTFTQDVPFERTYLSDMSVIQSPDVLQCVGPSVDPHAVVESSGIVIPHDMLSEIQPSTSVLAKQSTCLPGQQRLATSQHRPAETELVGILGTEVACNLQPEVQPSTSMLDEPEEVENEPEVENESEAMDETAEEERAGTLGSLASQDLQSEKQLLTSTQDVPFERTYLSGMRVLQSPTIHEIVEPSLDPHAGVEPVGVVTAQDVHSKIQPSASVSAEQSTSLPAQQSLATSQQPQAEAKPAGVLDAGVEPSTSVQDERAEAEDEPEVPEVEGEPEAEDEPEIEDGPAEAERAPTLGAIPAQDLQPEMQSSTSMQVVPFEQTYLSCMPVVQDLAIHQSVEPSLDPHAGVESAGMVTAQNLQSKIPPSATVPAEQSTRLPAQQSLATSQHPPTQEKPAAILGTEPACDLQPEVQPSTSVQDEAAEPQDEPEVPEVEDEPEVPEVEDELEAEGEPGIEEEPAEAAQAGTLGLTQDLQPELQSLTTVQHVPLERIYSEERRQIGFQPNMVLGPEQPIQIPPVTTLVFSNPILSDEPLKNELDRLMHCNNVLSKDHEHKKSLLLIEYNQEIDKIEKSYDSLLQNEDSTYHQTQQEFTDLYKKVLLNKSLAENLQGVSPPSSAAQGRSKNPVMEQPFESSSRAQTAASPVILSSAIRPPEHNSPGSYARPLLVAQPSSLSSSWNAQPQLTLPGNLYGTVSSLSVPAPMPYGSGGSAGAQWRAVQPQSALPANLCRTTSPVPLTHLPHRSYGFAGVQLRASAPHLQQLRMPSPYAIHTDQQQLPAANAGDTSLGQYAPVILESFASSIPQGGALLNSVDPSSVHQTMLPSASCALPAYSLPSGRHPESMVNFLQSSGSNPAFFPAQQPSYQNRALGSTSDLPNAAPGSQHAGAHIARANQSGSESASLNAYLPARFGLGSSHASAGGSTVVVCLSDDEP